MHSKQLNRLYQQVFSCNASGYKQLFSHHDIYVQGSLKQCQEHGLCSQVARVQILTPHPDITITLVNKSMFTAISGLWKELMFHLTFYHEQFFTD